MVCLLVVLFLLLLGRNLHDGKVCCCEDQSAWRILLYSEKSKGVKPKMGLAIQSTQKFQQQGADAMRLTDVIATARGTCTLM